jgi:hypothetical protein
MRKITSNKLSTIKKISSKMPKTINEAINFNEDMAYGDEDMDMMDDEPMEEPMEEPMDAPVEEPQGAGAEKLLADIRKMSINGLAKLADNPDDPNYEMLKKIFLMLDKAVTEKQEQREVMAKNPNAGQNM